MGANPPQHTKIRVIVPGDTYEQKMSIVINAFDYFGMQFFPDKALEIMRNKDDMLMDIVLSSAGIVQLSLLFPNPDSKVLNKVYINSEVFLKIQKCLGNVEPVLIEYQHLEKGFGYGVYKEGFDVLLHYKIFITDVFQSVK